MILKFEGSLGRPTLISEVSGTPGTLSLGYFVFDTKNVFRGIVVIL
jgi:hypothetical protein